ncbi:lactonase family protein [Haloferula sp. BvORR071]|uniref:lactonase family protein n=1 Tax=Haloferula sp. BvORR071 TaxID=1396141 RepID=UPI0006978B57|nr:lactonase family protein [Haloferula sp. BvORR071]
MKPRLLLFGLASISLSSAAPLPFAIGTNAGGSGKSEGIYLSSFDPDTAQFGEVKLGAKYNGPGFLALHPGKPLLYAAGKSTAFPQGSVAVFKLGSTLEFLAEATSAGNNPCHLALNASGSVLALANYSDGTTTTFHLDADGIPKEPAFAKKITEGMGPNKGRQEGPHSHGVYFRGDFLHDTDLGLDKILTWTIDPKTAKPVSETPDTWTSAPGAGPRHLDFSPDGRHAYIVDELDNTVTACSYDAKAGKFTTLQTITTLPEGDQTRSTTAEIAVHPNGKFVYASNRGHDSIAVYARDAASGKLSSLQIAPCGGKVPRHFAITPDGKWLLCAHQDTNSIAALPLDPATGKLSEPKATATAPNPICILFLPAK